MPAAPPRDPAIRAAELNRAAELLVPPCPRCGAAPGQPCRARTGRELWPILRAMHGPRLAALGSGDPWDRADPARAVPCPHCGVATGSACLAVDGRIQRIHTDRRRLAWTTTHGEPEPNHADPTPTTREASTPTQRHAPSVYAALSHQKRQTLTPVHEAPATRPEPAPATVLDHAAAGVGGTVDDARSLTSTAPPHGSFFHRGDDK